MVATRLRQLSSRIRLLGLQGELAMLGNATRSASVYADTPITCWTLSADTLDQLSVRRPEIEIAILINLSLDLAQKLRQANQLIGVLAA